MLRTTDISSGSIDWDTVPFCLSEPNDIDKYLLQDGDIVISRAGSVGFSYLIKNPKRAIFASYLIRFRPLINEKFVSYFLQSPDYWEAISKRSLGIAIPNVNATKLKQIPIPLPPLPEQERIVQRIESLLTQLDAGLAGLKRAKAALKRYKASVLKSACEGRLVPQDPSDEPAELPKGWNLVTVEEIGNKNEQIVLTGPFGSNLGSEDFEESGTPVLTIGCLTEYGLNLDKAKYISEVKAKELDKYRVREGDLLFSRMATVGRAGLVTKQFDNLIFNYHLMRLRLDARLINPYYFLYYVRGSRNVSDYVKEVNHGATRDGINTEQLLALPVSLPTLIEQQRIVAEVERRLSLVQELEQTIEANLKRATRLRQAILKRAFEGKLVTPPIRATHSQTDEILESQPPVPDQPLSRKTGSPQPAKSRK